MSDEQYVETRFGHNAAGSPIPSLRVNVCVATTIRGFSNVFECVLFRDHDVAHESMGGSSWEKEKNYDNKG